MDHFCVAHGAGDSWARLAKQCGQELGPKGACGNLGLIYVTEALAGDLSSIVTYLRETTGIAHWAGAVAAGICAPQAEYFDGPALAVLACNFDAGRFQILPTVGADVSATLVGMGSWLGRTQPRFGIVHADPRSNDVAATIEVLAEVSGCFLVGGMTAGRDEAQVADVTVGEGVSGVLFAQDVEVATGLTQGCSPIGEMHTVTAMANRVVAELDDRPALEIFREEIGEVLARDLSRAAGYVHAALAVTGSDTGDYMVRNLLGIDVDSGCLAIGERLAVGDRLMFVRRDPLSAKKDMLRMLTELKDRVGDGAKGGIYHSCVARGEHQFGPGAVEMTMIHEVFGDLPVVGFFGNGEIFHDRLYAYTGVLTLFV
ncbi:MAG: FIST signal transduction protein [Alphaproteobacteria bacterium]